MAGRFVLHTDTDVENFLNVGEKKNKKKNRRGLDFSFGVPRDGERVSKTLRSAIGRIGYLAEQVLLSVRKKSGEEYEPTTLRGFIASVERHLKKQGFSDSIITGQPFAKT